MKRLLFWMMLICFLCLTGSTAMAADDTREYPIDLTAEERAYLESIRGETFTLGATFQDIFDVFLDGVTPSKEVQIVPQEELSEEQQQIVADTMGQESQGKFLDFTPPELQIFERDLGIDFALKPAVNMNSLERGLMEGSIDFVVGLVDSRERKEYLTFLPPFVEFPFACYIREGADINEVYDLYGLRVGFRFQSDYEEVVEQYPEIKFQPVFYTEKTQLPDALLKQEVDAYILDTGNYTLIDITNTPISVAFTFNDLSYGYSLALRKEEALLASIMKKEVEYQLEHELGELIQKQYREYNSNVLNLTEAEKNYLAGHPKIRVGFISDYMPIEYVDEDGEPRGLGIEYIKEISRLTGIQFVYDPETKSKTWNQVLEDFRAGDLDLLTCVTVTEDRKSWMRFTRPYSGHSITIVGNVKDPNVLTRASDLEGSVVAVPNGYWVKDYLNHVSSNIQVLSVKDQAAAFRSVESGKADYLVIEIPVFSYQQAYYGYDRLKIIGEIDKNALMQMAVQPDQAVLTSIIDKCIETIDRDRLEDRAMLIPQSKRNEVFFYGVIVIMAFALAGSLLLTYRSFHGVVIAKEEAEHAWEEAEKERKKAVKANEEKDRMLMHISHDLRTPLTTIRGSTEALQEDLLEEDEKPEFYQLITQKVDTLDRMVGDIHNLSKLQAKRVQLNPDLYFAKQFLSSVHFGTMVLVEKAGLDYEIQLPKDDALIKIDGFLLEKAMNNLIQNAVKFTKPPGKIILRLLMHTDEVVFQVQDSGTGIPEQDLPFVFDEFYKASRSRSSREGGSGLGLAIVKEIVELHHGKVTAQSEWGEGTTISIRIKKAGS